MSKKTPSKPKTPALCIICEKEVDPRTAFSMSLKRQMCYMCDEHAEAFKVGFHVGQLEINSKFLKYIDDTSPEVVDEIKRAIEDMAPMSFSRTQTAEPKEEINSPVITPREVNDKLSEVVIGQEDAKKSVSVSAINHLKSFSVDPELVSQSDKHHVLLLGKSGSGKTLIVNTLSKILQLPYSHADATNFSPAGYIGADADSSVYDLLVKSKMDNKVAERGVVFIDEIDKICTTSKNQGRFEQHNAPTQSALLKLIEGKIVKVPGPVFNESPHTYAQLSTEKMLFFFGGAFNGLSDVLAKKMGLTQRAIGFTKLADDNNKKIDEAMKSYEIFSQAPPDLMFEALIEYGMIAELASRIPTVVALKPLSKEDLRNVLFASSVSPLKKQKEIFASCGIGLEFTEEYIDKVVDLAYKSATGTRALHSIITKSLRNASFDLLSLRRVYGEINSYVEMGEATIDDPSKYNHFAKLPSSVEFIPIEIPLIG